MTVSDQTTQKPPPETDPHVPESWLVHTNMTSPFYNWAVTTSNQEEEQKISLVQQQIWSNLAESSVFMTDPISPSKKLIARQFVFYSTQTGNSPAGQMLVMLVITLSVGMYLGSSLWLNSELLLLLSGNKANHQVHAQFKQISQISTLSSIRQVWCIDFLTILWILSNVRKLKHFHPWGNTFW